MKKLRVPPAGRAVFVNAPEGYVDALGLPPEVTPVAEADGQTDFVQLFVRDSAELVAALDTVFGRVRPDCVLWVCYPKRSSGIQTDLTRDEGWQALDSAGWRGVASVAIDDVWSGVRFRPGTWDAGAEGIDAQYAGRKAALRPILERIQPIVTGFGDDVETAVRKTYVAFVRGKQFAVVQPTTSTRVDVGLKLPGVVAAGRLEPSTNVGGGAITHKVALATADEIDDELIDWLRAAYEATA
jgi:hypothetical protein